MENCGSYLPLDIITNVLSRLPVKPLCRFRCVSKQWCNLLDSTYFMNKHFNDSTKTNNNQRLVISNAAKTSLYSLDICNFFEKKMNRKDKNVLVEMNAPLMKKKPVQVWGSCQGLLCLSTRNDQCLIIWNPATRKHQNLPLPSFPFDSTMYVYGFGYVSQANDYILVRMQRYQNQYFEHHEVDVYSHRSNSWREVGRGLPDNTLFRYSLYSASSKLGVLVNECLHWVNCYRQIFAFEIGYDSFRMVPALPDINNMDVLDLSITTLDDCMCAVRKVSNVGFEVWVMTEYGLKESWTKLLTLDYWDHMFLGAFYSDCFSVVPAAYYKDRNNVLFQKSVSGRRWFLSYDLVKKTLSEVDILNMTGLSMLTSYSESFVDPNVGCLTDGE